ncbi:unnamed protein product [Pleuronectes platessa]|uniref:Uncharacterized protein n=1 Tax=Pleuronectes platessa TaxID=8262 RepID=A0A9N7VGU3_PLEPL|nr:unnamed protein product [Pleuronectes platessa]
MVRKFHAAIEPKATFPVTRSHSDIRATVPPAADLTGLCFNPPPVHTSRADHHHQPPAPGCGGRWSQKTQRKDHRGKLRSLIPTSVNLWLHGNQGLQSCALSPGHSRYHLRTASRGPAFVMSEQEQATFIIPEMRTSCVRSSYDIARQLGGAHCQSRAGDHGEQSQNFISNYCGVAAVMSHGGDTASDSPSTDRPQSHRRRVPCVGCASAGVSHVSGGCSRDVRPNTAKAVLHDGSSEEAAHVVF